MYITINKQVFIPVYSVLYMLIHLASLVSGKLKNLSVEQNMKYLRNYLHTLHRVLSHFLVRYLTMEQPCNWSVILIQNTNKNVVKSS